MPDDPQFEELYNQYKELVYNLALQFTQQRSDAEDITQEVFIRIHQHYHRYDPAVSSLKTWIYRITINKCLDHQKARKSKKRFAFLTGLFLEQETDPLPVAVQFDHPGIKAEYKEALQRLFREINKLPANQKTALILTRIEGWSHKETAEIMRTTAKAVESLLQRARKTLAERFPGDERGIDH